MDDFNLREIDENAIFKEPFVIDNVDVRTRLHKSQVENVNKAQSIGIIFNNNFLLSYLDGFMVKQKSLNGSSLREFLEAFKSRFQDLRDKPFKNFSMYG